MDVDGEDLQTLTDRDQAPWGPDRNRKCLRLYGRAYSALHARLTEVKTAFLDAMLQS
jgi:hypothetical protein